MHLFLELNFSFCILERYFKKKLFWSAFSHFLADFVPSTFDFNNGQTFDTKFLNKIIIFININMNVYIYNFQSGFI